MGDLISRKLLIDSMDKRYNEKVQIVPDNLAEGFHQMSNLIREQPTAFDLESVIDKLEKLKTYKLDLADAILELMKRDKLGNYVCLEDVLEILISAANGTDGKNGG